MANKYVVRLYDGFDNQWIDITGSVDCDEAWRVWIERTDEGEHHCKYEHLDYYKIFPANTQMFFSGGRGEREH